jgi:predicted LPLAT superfamily acyltransferase
MPGSPGGVAHAPTHPNFGNRAGFAVFHLVIQIAGPRPAYFLLALLVPYYLLLRTSGRLSAYFYLRRRFPGLGEARLFMKAARHIYEFGKTLIDQAAMGILKKERFKIEERGGELLRRLSKDARGMVLLTTHAGNWQAAMANMDLIGKKVNLLFNLGGIEGRHFFDLAGQRDRFHFIAPDGFLGGMIEAATALNAGEALAIMGDRAFGTKTVEMDFLGAKAPFPMAPYYLVSATGAHLVVLLTARTGPLSFTVESRLISGDEDWAAIPRETAVKELMGRYVACLEEYVEKHPYMWFNFFDFWQMGKRKQS